MTTKKPKFGFCDNPKCKKKLIVPSWRFCEDCDYSSFKNRYIRNQKKIAKEVVRQFKLKKVFLEKIKKSKKAIDTASVLVIDEKGKVIGYKL